MSAQRTPPPHDLEAEEGALGAAMLSSEALAVVLDRLTADDFHRPAHRTIYCALAELRDRGRPVDPTTVRGELARTGALADVGGAPFLHTLVQGVPTVAHVGEYVTTVARLGRTRRLIDAGHRIVQAGYEDPDNIGRTVAHAQAVLADLAASNGAVGARLLAGLRNGAWLDAQDFPPLAYTVLGVIPEGSVLLVGPPKIGKSWFVLAVALAAASGGRVLGQEVPKRPVLYLALEDGDRRLQDRCRVLLRGDPIPPEFEYLTRVEPGQILDTIGSWLAHRDAEQAPLVILDTLGKVMPPALLGESSYQRDYRVGTALKRLADQRPGMTLLVNHHDRKAGAEDFIDSVSGTHGLAGAADTVVVLTRPRQEEGGRLKVTGRDVAESEYAVRFLDGSAWTLDGHNLATSARRARDARVTAGLGDRSTEVVEVVGRHPEGITPTQVAGALGMDPKAAQVYLSRALAAGRVSRPKRGRYTPVGSVGSVGSPGQGDVPSQQTNGEVLASREPLTSQANTTNGTNTPSGQDRLPLAPDPGGSP